MNSDLDTIITLCQGCKNEIALLSQTRRRVLYTDDKTKPIDERIKIAENAFDQLDENFQRREKIYEKCILVLDKLKSITSDFENDLEKFNSEREDTYITLADTLVDLKTSQADARKAPYLAKAKEIEEAKDKDIKEYIKIREKYKDDLKLKSNGISHEEKEALEKFSNSKIKSLVFDSEKDDWAQGSSEFDDKVMGKKNLLFLVEDNNNNKFGGVFTEKVDRTNEYIEDTDAFIFSLIRKGKFNPKKFELKSDESKDAFTLCGSRGDYLFAFGGQKCDIAVYKKGKDGSRCFPNSYTESKNAFVDNNKFTPKSVKVFQLENSEDDSELVARYILHKLLS
ncbi:hypothetical protein EIN_446470 [Entamoeba invadens IP1]|uniref:TLDc domain-containing protein n=1 Tax=Entamoeba invadens IP1 TaxID=370355 RepID=L7FKB7_ENTIV|nr:hypothetical protein EIN_446470 [Entamoeba invadens IP1]ELP86050.1 hypothetical protein EIN_446470 [Entamoeba invadens IP1]|eukprot:XP_004185396.1 hypothetical protein EIN_446470 [Entamoeba invadens IP1]